MGKWLAVGLLLLLLAGGLIWWQPWHQPTSPGSLTATITPTPLPACGVAAGTNVTASAEIKLSQPWTPVRLRVGQTVRWLNDTETTYTLQSVPAEGDACPGFNPVTIKPSQSAQLTLLRAGSWSFSDGQDGGVITVQ